MEDLETLLKSFAESIKPTPLWMDRANWASRRVFDLLKTRSKMRLVRIERVGGMEKGTSTKLKADVDVVIFYDDQDGRWSRKDVS